MDWPKLSIVTPSLNQGEFLESSICSVLDQKYPNLEYYIVDGGSTDNSLEIIRRYEKQLTRWVSEPDEGQSHAINKGLKWASGEVAAYLNSDDVYKPGAFATVVNVYRRLSPEERARGVWFAGACEYVSESGEVVKIWKPELPPPEREKWIGWPWSVPQASTFWQRQLFEQYGRFREGFHYVFDTEFALRLVFAGYYPTTVPEVLAVRLLHRRSKTMSAGDAFVREAACLLPIFGPALTPPERRLARYMIEQTRCNRQIASKQYSGALATLLHLWVNYPDRTVRRSFEIWRMRLSRLIAAFIQSAP